MKAVSQHVHGRIINMGEHAGLLLMESDPASESVDSIYLRYAFTLQGVEESILPAFVLDDWGSEIAGLDLYEWVREFGDQFPRAELFGFDLRGRETQCFLRELDLFVQLRCFAYPAQKTPISDGVWLESFFIPDDSVSTPIAVKRPSSIKRPLRSVKASWWRVNPATTDFSLTLS